MLLGTEAKECTVQIKDAVYPVPFEPGLEFNPPVHGTWNIVHIGMNIPEAVQIYVCAINCMRGVVLTAAEMNCMDRFSCVILEDKDILNGNVEDITIEGVTDALNRMEKLPPVVLLFTVCTHHFLGSNLKRIYAELEKRFPTVIFERCFMDPIMQKRGLTPDQKLRRSMGELLLSNKSEECVSILGCDFQLEENCDLKRILEEKKIPYKEIHDCNSFEEYRMLGNASTLICTYPPGVVGVSAAARRLQKSFYYFPSCFDYDEIRTYWEKIYKEIGRVSAEQDYDKVLLKKVQEEEEACDKVLAETGKVVGDTVIYIDGSAHPRPLGLAKLLLQHGFRVKRVYLDAINPEEANSFHWLKEHYGNLEITAIIQPEGRVRKRGGGEKVLAIGQKAAWYADTPYFVNIVQGAGLWGYSGIRTMASLLKEACIREKDTRDIVPRKGLGCESCV